MNMRLVLSPDECDKMNHFFEFLLEIDRHKQPGHHIDMGKAMAEYRKKYGATEKSDKQIAQHVESNAKKSADRESHRAELEANKELPISVVAKIIGRKTPTVANWYHVMGIVRPISYKGRRYEGGVTQ